MLSASNEPRMKIKASWLGGTGESEMFYVAISAMVNPAYLTPGMDGRPSNFLGLFLGFRRQTNKLNETEHVSAEP